MQLTIRHLQVDVDAVCQKEIENASVALALIAVGIVVFWRVVLRVLLALIAIAVVIMVGAGAIALLQGMHR